MLNRKANSDNETPTINVPQIYSEKLNIRNIPNDTIIRAPKLVLKVIEGPIMQGTVIEINAAGIAGGTRSDGVTYFGQCSDNEYIHNDYNFPMDELGVGKRHMMIKYETNNKYYIKDLADGTGTFIKITKQIKLESGYLLSFGESHMTILIESHNIIIKFLEGMRANEKRYANNQNIYSI